MRLRLLPVVTTGVLALSLLVPTLGSASAAGPDREVTGPSLPGPASETAREQATDALDEAQAIFAERSPAAARRLLAAGGADATMALNQLVRVRADLTASERREADALLTRPTDPGGDEVFNGTVEYTEGEETPVCGVTICIHYSSPGDTDAPPTTDTTPANGIPDAVDQALATAEQVHTTYVDAGYRPPDSDGTRGGEAGKVDIYLADTGELGVYGYCTADDDATGSHLPAYCVIDEDFAEFPALTPLENQQVTLAHEYFHAVQFAYDFFEDAWIMEATATWAEDEVFDDVDDNRQYLPDSQLVASRSPLDRWSGEANYQYGNWIFFRYLTERWTAETGSMPTLVLDVWEQLSARAGDPNQFSTRALQTVLAARGRNFTTVYGQFADANRRPGQTYDEGASYPVAGPARTWRLSTTRRGIGRGWFAPVNHLTSIPLRFRPTSSLTRRDWKLRLTVDMPPATSAPVARLTTYLRNGAVDATTIRLRRTGASRAVVGFSVRDVRYVELVLVNASRRVRGCESDFQGDVFACYGIPRDDGRRTDFGASIFRR